jgi:hypothetical protein
VASPQVLDEGTASDYDAARRSRFFDKNTSMT